jgi:hypothetical protein
VDFDIVELLASAGPNPTSPGSHTIYARLKAHRVLLAKYVASLGMIGIGMEDFASSR